MCSVGDGIDWGATRATAAAAIVPPRPPMVPRSSLLLPGDSIVCIPETAVAATMFAASATAHVVACGRSTVAKRGTSAAASSSKILSTSPLIWLPPPPLQPPPPPPLLGPLTSSPASALKPLIRRVATAAGATPAATAARPCPRPSSELVAISATPQLCGTGQDLLALLPAPVWTPPQRSPLGTGVRVTVTLGSEASQVAPKEAAETPSVENDGATPAAGDNAAGAGEKSGLPTNTPVPAQAGAGGGGGGCGRPPFPEECAGL